MAKITIGDVTGTAQVVVDDSSLAGTSEFVSLISGTTEFLNQLPQRIDQASFQSATLNATFETPAISIDDKRSLTVKAGANAVLTRYTASDSPLLGSDPTAPEIDIKQGDYWLSFELDGTLEISGTQTAGSGSGFGVTVDAASTAKLYFYALFSGIPAALPALGTAIGDTLSGFRMLVSASDVRNQKPGTVCVADISGTVTVSGSYSFPIGVNQLVLAEALIPFNFELKPSLTLKVGGSVALTGDYSVRSWRQSDTELVLALFKQRGTTLTGTFTAGAGLAGAAGNTDLIETFFEAVAPGIDLQTVLPNTDPRYAAINQVLNDSISQALEISVNASCAASFGNEAALVYSIDLTGDRATTDAAINAAIGGDWSLLSTLQNATELKNVVGGSQETKVTISINLLGLFNYESVADFVRSSTVLHSAEDGSITITDQATATRISVASTPYLADPDKLRSVLYEATLATAAYAVGGGAATANFTVKQSLVLYAARTTSAALRKDLRLAIAIGELTPAQLSSIPIANPKPAHALIDASQQITGAQTVNMFFEDPVARTPRDLDQLKSLGRQTLANLLDPSDPVDQRRIEVLNSPAIWADMDSNRFPQDSPASYSDWFDVTFWANSIHDAAPPLKAVLQAFDQVPQGTDPSQNANLTKARKAFTKAMGEVTHDTHAAFEKGWPIAVMYALAGGDTGASMTAKWDSMVQIPVQQPLALRPNALAKRLAGRTVGAGQGQTARAHA